MGSEMCIRDSSYRLPMCVEGEKATNLALHHFYFRVVYPWHTYLFCLLEAVQQLRNLCCCRRCSGCPIMTTPSLLYCHICDERLAHIYALTYCDQRKCQMASDRCRVGSKMSTCSDKIATADRSKTAAHHQHEDAATNNQTKNEATRPSTLV